MFNWRNELQYLWRYACAGGLNAVVGLSSIFLLMWAGFSPIFANIAGYLLSLILAFFIAKKFVFRSAGKIVTESILYLLAFGLSFLCNFGMLHISLEILELHPSVAQFISISVYIIVMYFTSRLFVFPSADSESRG